MKGRARCWRCVALGLLASGLIHAAAAGWWLRDWSPPTDLPESPTEAHRLELDLGIFASAPSEPAATPETLALAADPEPEPLPEPDPEPEPPSPPMDEPEALPEEVPVPPEPPPTPIPPQPEIPVEPEIAPEPELQPPAPPAPKPQVRVKRPEKQPISRPKKPVQRQPPKPEKRARQEETDPRTAPHTNKTAGPNSAGPTATKAQTGPSGSAAAPRSAGKAEASYLAELQRAIARHQRFPDDARKRRKTGVTTLAFVVQGDGRIRQVRVAKSSGDASLDEAAVQALQRLNRFRPIPAVIGRQEWAMRVPIRFDLR